MGAHPGYPDKANFGRLSLDMSADELAETLRAQLALLLDKAKLQGVAVAYVKPHGALNHDMLQKPEIFQLICQTVSAINSELALMVPTNAMQEQQQATASKYGLSIWWEVFADRAYEPTGLLRPRKFDDAVHENPQTIIEQLNTIRQRGEIVAVDGTVLDIGYAQTICVHGDHAPSVAAVRQLRD